MTGFFDQRKPVAHHVRRAFEQLDCVECEEEAAFRKQAHFAPRSVMDAVREGKSAIWDIMMFMIDHRESYEDWRFDKEVEEAYLLRDEMLKEGDA